jgi:hypothetical protein
MTDEVLRTEAHSGAHPRAEPRVRIRPPPQRRVLCEPDFRCREDTSAGPSSMGAAEAVATCLMTGSLSLKGCFRVTTHTSSPRTVNRSDAHDRQTQ